MEMDVQHFSHEHPLILINDEQMCDKICHVCVQPIFGPMYHCKTHHCKFFIHHSCAKLPLTIQHPLHQDHTLTLLRAPNSPSSTSSFFNSFFICSLCNKLGSGFVYYCPESQEQCHICCGILSNTLPAKHESHHHLLSLLKSTEGFSCHACSEKNPSKFMIGCTICNFGLHFNCASLPAKAKHKRHLHPLTLVYDGSNEDHFADDFICDACEMDRNPKQWVYYCWDCEFVAETSCITQQFYLFGGNFEHDSHEHPLSFVYKDELLPPCNVCGNPWEGLAYKCLICKFHIHLPCASLKKTLKHEDHEHLLSLTYECGLGKRPRNVCDICQDEMSPSVAFYSCIQCDYVAHVLCLCSKSQVDLYTQMLPESIFRERNVVLTVRLDCHQHSVTMKLDFAHSVLRCHICGGVVEGEYCYSCERCKFTAHMTCGHNKPLLPRSKNFMHLSDQMQALYEQRGASTEDFMRDYQHPYHKHFLAYSVVYHSHVKRNIADVTYEPDRWVLGHLSNIRGNCSEDEIYFCLVCANTYQRTAYTPTHLCCTQCSFFLHFSCAELPVGVQHVCHPLHPLHPRLDRQSLYGCRDCGFTTDEPLVESSFTLQLENHEHPLKMFQHGCMKVHWAESILPTPLCNTCGNDCKGTTFRCDRCDYNLHFECALFPRTIKHACHQWHPLVLTHRILDDSDEFYCDACEKERDPKFGFFYCEECEYAAHPNCVASEVLPFFDSILKRSNQSLKLLEESDQYDET